MTASGHPNIVWIMADDMGWGDLGCYGSVKVPTPNMDRIASEGMRFRDAHSSSAVCTPSRYSVMTGRYCWRTWLRSGVLGGFGKPLIEPDRMTVASLLKRHGYRTASVGKWHLGLEWTTKEGVTLVPTGDIMSGWDDTGFNVDYRAKLRGGPTELGFDYSFNIAGSLDMPPYCFIENDQCVGDIDQEKREYFAQQRLGMQAADWRDDLVDVTFARKAVDFIDRNAHAETDAPFYLYLTPSAPHRPCLPPGFAQGQTEAGNRGDTVWLVDWMVGEVLDALERNGLTNETLIICTSDNGARELDVDGIDYGHKPNGNWRGAKADIWEGGHREPFVVRWPGRVKPGTVCDQTICLVDLLATCADIVGDRLPDNAAEDSFSFLPHLTGSEAIAARPPVIHHSAHGMFALRSGSWKLIDGLGSGGFTTPRHEEPHPGGPAGQLYNLDTDPREQNNAWLSERDILASLRTELDRCREADGSRAPR